MSEKETVSRESLFCDFIYAATLLKKIPRSGYVFLGSGSESVADHSYGTALIGFTLAKLADANVEHTVMLCLAHDLPEVCTGDFNYVNHRYDKGDYAQALKDICGADELYQTMEGLRLEFENGDTLEARLARDADQLDMICSLKRELARGNLFSQEWLKSATLRIKTDAGKKLCSALLRTTPWHWWYNQVDEKWWINRSKE